MNVFVEFRVNAFSMDEKKIAWIKNWFVKMAGLRGCDIGKKEKQTNHTQQ